ncbi:AfsR/SARP family transcriptional regulator [Amycolatopsis anabasis]|uniref:AfsR/SARP family transcriptional regulator n=1 Tax=Amycolatopsis anabasis TaxID=1840409 RepID=UPI00131A6D5B|nr:BTAD domain-containing putative transcriptional regulator [Amycolatopsis anabasis]
MPDAANPPFPLSFRVLGEVRAERDGRELPLGPPQRRAVLAALLLRGGRSASAGELVDAVWGERPPPRALGALRTHAFQLRAVLEPGRSARSPGELLVSVGDGYALRVPGAAVDARRFEDLLAAASADPAGAAETLRAALDLWTGTALAGIPGPFAERERDRLAELRSTAREELFACELELGRTVDVVAGLRAFVAEHPLRERAWALLMLALHRAGRQAEALDAYAEARRVLVAELGIEPGPELAARHAQVLAGEPAAPVRGPVPAQLPADPADFTGRARLTAELGAVLGSAHDAVRVGVLTGLGGAGKTALALHAAHAARPGFPDGQLYADLRGAEAEPVDAGAVLTGFLHALGVGDGAVPDGVAERAARYRSRLAGRRMLVVLDNAADSAQVRPLLPGAPGCAVLVTTRSRTLTVPGARYFEVPEFDADEGLALLAAILGADRVAAEPDAARDLVTACGGLPLAIRIVAGRLVTRPSRPLSALAARLRDERQRFDELRHGELAVEPVFRVGSAALEPEAARAFRLLAVPDLPPVTAATAAVVLDRAEDVAEGLAERLVDAGLVEPVGPDRYRYHDLVAAFARRESARADTAAEREAAVRRVADHVLATVLTAAAHLAPGSALVRHLDRPSAPGVPLADAAEARAWLDAEHRLLLAAVTRVMDVAPATAADVLWAWSPLIVGTAGHRELEPPAERALELLRGDDRRAARMLRLLAAPHYGSDSFARAEKLLRESLRRAGDGYTAAVAARDLGVVLLAGGDPAGALPPLLRARELFTELGGDADRILLHSHVARARAELDRAAEAEATVSDALEQARELGQDGTLAHVLYQAGCVALRSGHPGLAQRRLRYALARYSHADDLRWQGLVLARLAHCALAEDRADEAVATADRALAIERELGDGYCRGLALTARGRARWRLGDAPAARADLHAALDVLRRRGAAEAAGVAAFLDEIRR